MEWPLRARYKVETALCCSVDLCATQRSNGIVEGKSVVERYVMMTRGLYDEWG